MKISKGRKFKPVFRLMSCLVIMVFSVSSIILPNQSYSQTVLNLPHPGMMVVGSPIFVPTHLVGMTINPDDPFLFDFIVDTGHSDLKGKNLKKESEKLIRYFLTTLTIPEEDLWVNLSPYEGDRIIADEFGMTEMGQILLEQDYLLKQLTASLIYPEKDLGKKFWDRVYQKAVNLYGTSEIPVNTFNKVWIVPDRATVYEHQNTVIINNADLRVMLDKDYLAITENFKNKEIGTDQLAQQDIEALNNVSSQVIRDVILPAIEKEVNEGKNFAPLRQVYHSMILATWYKSKLRNSPLNDIYSDQRKIVGVDVEDKTIKQKIYNQYLEAFQRGVYDYIKEDYDEGTQQLIPRKYFSGGMDFLDQDVETDASLLTETGDGNLNVTRAGLRFVRESPSGSPAALLERVFLEKGSEEIVTMEDAISVLGRERHTLRYDFTALEEMGIITPEGEGYKIAPGIANVGGSLVRFLDTVPERFPDKGYKRHRLSKAQAQELRPYVQNIVNPKGRVIEAGGIYNYPNFYSDTDLRAYYDMLVEKAPRYKKTLSFDDFTDGIETLRRFVSRNLDYIQTVIAIDPGHHYAVVKYLWERVNDGQTYMDREAFDDLIKDLDSESLGDHPEIISVLFTDYGYRDSSVETYVFEDEIEEVGSEAGKIKARYGPQLNEALEWSEKQLTQATADRKLLERQKKVYAYLKIRQKQKEEGRKSLIKAKTIASQAREEGLLDDQTPSEAISRFPDIDQRDKIEALFAVLVYEVSQGVASWDDVYKAILAYGYTDYGHAFAVDATVTEAVNGFAQIVGDRYRELQKASFMLDFDVDARPLEERGKSLIPKALSQRLSQVRSRAESALKEIGARETEAKGTYNLLYMGFESGYRGHIGDDCTECAGMGDAYASLHPANHYYALERGGTIYGYVGFTEASIPGREDLKFLAVDTLQFPDARIPDRAIPDILDAIEQVALERGFIGIALPATHSLAGSFNHEQVRNAVENLDKYKNGLSIVLDPLYPEATKKVEDLAEKVSESIFHQIFTVYTQLDPKVAREILPKVIGQLRLPDLDTEEVPSFEEFFHGWIRNTLRFLDQAHRGGAKPADLKLAEEELAERYIAFFLKYSRNFKIPITQYGANDIIENIFKIPTGLVGRDIQNIFREAIFGSLSDEEILRLFSEVALEGYLKDVGVGEMTFKGADAHLNIYLKGLRDYLIDQIVPVMPAALRYYFSSQKRVDHITGELTGNILGRSPDERQSIMDRVARRWPTLSHELPSGDTEDHRIWGDAFGKLLRQLSGDLRKTESSQIKSVLFRGTVLRFDSEAGKEFELVEDAALPLLEGGSIELKDLSSDSQEHQQRMVTDGQKPYIMLPDPDLPGSFISLAELERHLLEGEIGARHQDVKYLDRLTGRLGFGHGRDVEAALVQLKEEYPGLVREISDGDGKTIIVISEDVQIIRDERVRRIVRALKRYVVDPQKGVKGINFRASEEGLWNGNLLRVFFEEQYQEDTENLTHERVESFLREVLPVTAEQTEQAHNLTEIILGASNDNRESRIQAFLMQGVGMAARQASDLTQVILKELDTLLDLALVEDAPGGIDMRSQWLDLETRGKESEINFPTNLQPLHNDNILGITPFIINVTPLPSLKPILGLSVEEHEGINLTKAN